MNHNLPGTMILYDVVKDIQGDDIVSELQKANNVEYFSVAIEQSNKNSTVNTDLFLTIKHILEKCSKKQISDIFFTKKAISTNSKIETSLIAMIENQRLLAYICKCILQGNEQEDVDQLFASILGKLEIFVIEKEIFPKEGELNDIKFGYLLHSISKKIDQFDMCRFNLLGFSQNRFKILYETLKSQADVDASVLCWLIKQILEKKCMPWSTVQAFMQHVFDRCVKEKRGYELFCNLIAPQEIGVLMSGTECFRSDTEINSCEKIFSMYFQYLERLTKDPKKLAGTLMELVEKNLHAVKNETKKKLYKNAKTDEPIIYLLCRRKTLDHLNTLTQLLAAMKKYNVQNYEDLFFEVKSRFASRERQLSAIGYLLLDVLDSNSQDNKNLSEYLKIARELIFSLIKSKRTDLLYSQALPNSRLELYKNDKERPYRSVLDICWSVMHLEEFSGETQQILLEILNNLLEHNLLTADLNVLGYVYANVLDINIKERMTESLLQKNMLQRIQEKWITYSSMEQKKALQVIPCFTSKVMNKLVQTIFSKKTKEIIHINYSDSQDNYLFAFAALEKASVVCVSEKVQIHNMSTDSLFNACVILLSSPPVVKKDFPCQAVLDFFSGLKIFFPKQNFLDYFDNQGKSLLHIAIEKKLSEDFLVAIAHLMSTATLMKKNYENQTILDIAKNKQLPILAETIAEIVNYKPVSEESKVSYPQKSQVISLEKKFHQLKITPLKNPQKEESSCKNLFELTPSTSDPQYLYARKIQSWFNATLQEARSLLRNGDTLPEYEVKWQMKIHAFSSKIDWYTTQPEYCYDTRLHSKGTIVIPSRKEGASVSHGKYLFAHFTDGLRKQCGIIEYLFSKVKKLQQVSTSTTSTRQLHFDFTIGKPCCFHRFFRNRPDEGVDEGCRTLWKAFSEKFVLGEIKEEIKNDKIVYINDDFNNVKITLFPISCFSSL